MTVTFAEPSTAGKIQQRDAGGDNTVPRDGMKRPIIRIPCDGVECSGGRIPSAKRPGNTVQCPKCKGKGEYSRSRSRVTSYIDVLEDKSNLQAWGERAVLIGVALDPALTNEVLEKDQEDKDDRDWLNRRAKAAKSKAGSDRKAEKGTYLHGLSELKDQGLLLPDDVSFDDVIDMDAYINTYKNFEHVHMEKLVVVDELGVAGTPDRVSKWTGLMELIAPDGKIIGPDDLLITDLKTGRVDYGQLKIAMQLAIYSRGVFYDHTPEDVLLCRTPMGNVRQDWGMIINLPAGTGEAELYWADLTMGWEAVLLAGQVREIRNRGRKALVPVAKNKFETALATAA